MNILESTLIKSPDNTSQQAKNTKINYQSDVEISADKKSNIENSREREISKDDFFSEIRENLEKINDFIPLQSTSLVFEFDELGEPPVVKVLDKESQEVIREIPPKDFREMAQALQEVADKLSSSKGVLFNDTV